MDKRFKQIIGAQGRIRTSVARKERQIYSLLPLTTRPPVRIPDTPGSHIVARKHSPEKHRRESQTSADARRKEIRSVNILPHKGSLRRKNPFMRSAFWVILLRCCRQPCCATALCFRKNVLWSWRRDSNPRPSDYKSDALPAELRQQT